MYRRVRVWHASRKGGPDHGHGAFGVGQSDGPSHALTPCHQISGPHSNLSLHPYNINESIRQRAWGQQQQQLYRYQPGAGQQRRRYGGPNALDVGRENKCVALFSLIFGLCMLGVGVRVLLKGLLVLYAGHAQRHTTDRPIDRFTQTRNSMIPPNTCRRAAYLATFLGFLGGYWLSGWSLRAKNKKTKQKYEKEIAVRISN